MTNLNNQTLRTNNQKNSQAEKEIEVISLCQDKVYTVKTTDTQATFIHGNSGWIVMMEDGFVREKQQVLAALEEITGSIRSKVRAVICTQSNSLWQEAVKEFLNQDDSELPVYVLQEQNEEERQSIEGIAYYAIEKTQTILVDGVEITLIKDEKGLAVNLAQYNVNVQSREKEAVTFETKTEQERENVSHVAFSAEDIVGKIVKKIAKCSRLVEETVFLLEVLDKGDYRHFALDVKPGSAKYMEVEEELADYFWAAEVPIVQLSKTELRSLYTKNQTGEELFQSLRQLIVKVSKNSVVGL